MQQILALNSTSQADYEQLLRTLPPEKFRKFLFGMIGFQLYPTRYNDQFVPATNNFVLACRHIVGSQPSPRLAAILLRAFEISGVQFLLTSDDKNEISLSTSQE